MADDELMFNPPPADLNDREPLIHHASPGELWYRTYRIGSLPIFFSRSKGIDGTRLMAISVSFTSAETNTAPLWSLSAVAL
jgi:hypothetical protein